MADNSGAGTVAGACVDRAALAAEFVDGEAGVFIELTIGDGELKLKISADDEYADYLCNKKKKKMRMTYREVIGDFLAENDKGCAPIFDALRRNDVVKANQIGSAGWNNDYARHLGLTRSDKQTLSKIGGWTVCW